MGTLAPGLRQRFTSCLHALDTRGLVEMAHRGARAVAQVSPLGAVLASRSTGGGLAAPLPVWLPIYVSGRATENGSSTWVCTTHMELLAQTWLLWPSGE